MSTLLLVAFILIVFGPNWHHLHNEAKKPYGS